MRNLEKIIERYCVNFEDDGLAQLGWGNKLYYTKNSTTPILLSRKPGRFRFSDDGKVYELDNKHWTTTGGNLADYYPHPYFEDKKIKGFKVIRPLPEYKQDSVYLIQSGIQDDNYISGEHHKAIYLVRDCLDFPEFFEPVYD